MFSPSASKLYLVALLSVTSCSLLLEVPDDPQDTPRDETNGGQGPEVVKATGGRSTVVNQPTPTGGEHGLGGQTGSGSEAGTGGLTSSGGQTGSGGEIDEPECTENCDCKQACDCDDDGALAEACGGLDCDDDDSLVFPGQTKFFATRSTNPSVGFDFDCSGQLESLAKNVAVNCEGLTLGICDKAQGFLDQVPACGEAGRWGVCEAATLACKDSVVDNAKVVLCH